MSGAAHTIGWIGTGRLGTAMVGRTLAERGDGAPCAHLREERRLRDCRRGVSAVVDAPGAGSFKVRSGKRGVGLGDTRGDQHRSRAAQAVSQEAMRTMTCWRACPALWRRGARSSSWRVVHCAQSLHVREIAGKQRRAG